MKTFIALILISTTAMAGECCTGSCWTTGCCDYRQRCTYEDNYQKYECVNVKNPIDKMTVIKTSSGIQQAKKILTTSGGI